MESVLAPRVADPQAKAGPFVRPTLPSSLLVYTQNVFGLPFTRVARRFRALADQIRDLAPDVVFLQEVMLIGDDDYFRIEGYHPACLPRGLFNRGGLLMLCRVPLTRVRFHPFRAQGKWHNLQLSDRILGKGWLEAEAADWGLTFVNTHLVSTYHEADPSVLDLAQGSQLAQVLRRMAELGPSILAGDFNFTEDTPYHHLVEVSMEDAARNLGRPGPAHLQPKLDHVFVRDFERQGRRARLVVPGTIPAGRGSVSLSDHAGVLVALELGPVAPPRSATA